MNKPKAYDDTQIFFEPVTPGGHRCIIKRVREVKSSTDKDMLVIEFDMHQTDTQPRYFSNQYLADQKAGKTGDKLKWRGTGYLVVDESTDYGTRNLKAFNTAVTDSNPGFQIVWGDGYTTSLKDKLIGIVFREEEYTKEDYSLGMSVKPMRYCDFNKAFDQPVPKRKEAPIVQPQGMSPAPAEWLNQTTTNGKINLKQQTWTQAAQEGFMQIPKDTLSDEGLPFN